MELEAAAAVMSALGQTTRLKVVTLLADHEPTGLPASEIADLVGTPRNTMSGHLGILSNAGIVTSSRSGRTITYRLCQNVVANIADIIGRLSPAKLPNVSKRRRV
ncbi:metalloregulator ArsR/SmtB family transcription factor [Sphingosinicellaceae bacterium]|nr:metalloregulator ArsR/SmtB family transcription factor [Sphingosinicellaceae bacterium]